MSRIIKLIISIKNWKIYMINITSGKNDIQIYETYAKIIITWNYVSPASIIYDITYFTNICRK